MTRAIEVRDLWWRYSPETDWILRGINFDVRYGEAVAIVGPTGAGKTTLLSCLQSLLPHAFPQGEMKGTVIIDDADTKKIRAAQLAGRVGMAFEDAEAQFIFPTVEDDIAFALESLGLTQQEVRYRLERVLREFGLEDLRSQAAGELSGGQKQRASIAGLLAVQPKILLLDEPTAELDPAGKEGIVNIIRRIRSESDMTIVIVEQDLEEIAAFVDRFLLLDDGKIQRDSKPSDFFAEPDELLKHGVNPPEVCIIFASLKKSGILHSIPLTVSEAIEIIKSNR